MTELQRFRAAAFASFAADDAFEAALRAEGFASRWEWDHASGSCDLAAAYIEKLAAYRAVQIAWLALTGSPQIELPIPSRLLHS